MDVMDKFQTISKCWNCGRTETIIADRVFWHGVCSLCTAPIIKKDVKVFDIYDPIECTQDLPLDKYPSNFRIIKGQEIKDAQGNRWAIKSADDKE